MIRLVSLCLILIFFKSNEVLSQSCFEGERTAVNLAFAGEAAYTDGVNFDEAYRYVSEIEFQIDTIQSIGFQKYTFLHINIASLPKDWTRDVPLFGQNCNGYLVAVDENSQTAYRINGFMRNDLSILFSSYGMPPPKRGKFLRHHSILGHDLACFFDAWKANSQDFEKYPCLESCLRVVRF